MTINKATLFSLSRWGITLLFAYYLYRLINWQDMMEAFLQGNLTYLILAIIFVFLSFLIQAMRWGIFVKSSNSTIGLSTLVKIFIAGFFLDIYTPGTLGSDAYRIYKIRENISTTKAITVHAVFRLQGMIYQALIGVICLFSIGFFSGKSLDILFFTLLLSVFFIGLLLFIKQIYISQPRLRSGIYKLITEKFNVVVSSARYLLNDYQLLTNSTFLLIIYTFNNINIYLICMKAYGIEISYILLLATVPLLNLARMVPLTIQGRGVTEGLAYVLWQASGIRPEEAVLVCLSVYFLGLLNSILSGGFLFSLKGYSWKAR